MGSPEWPPMPAPRVDQGPVMTDKQRLDQSRWWERAACRGMDTSLFFPVLGQQVSEEVKALCAGCPVRSECHADAVLSRDRDGFRAGVYRSREQVGRVMGPINHGTISGYRAHYRCGVPMCESCRAAERVYRQGRAS